MDQKIRSQGGRLTAVICIFLSILLLPVGIGALASYPDPAWIFGILLTISSVLLLGGGIQTLLKSKRDWKKSKEFLKSITEEANRNTNNKLTWHESFNGEKPVVLANWVFSSEEWNSFFNKEVKTIGFDVLIGFFLIVIIGTLIFFNSGLWIGFFISLTIATMYSFGKFFINKKTVSGKIRENNRVILGLDTIVINDRLIILKDEQRWLSNVILKQDQDPNVIEFTCNWKTRSGQTFEDIRIPVPKTKTSEALQIISILHQFHRIH